MKAKGIPLPQDLPGDPDETLSPEFAIRTAGHNRCFLGLSIVVLSPAIQHFKPSGMGKPPPQETGAGVTELSSP